MVIIQILQKNKENVYENLSFSCLPSDLNYAGQILHKQYNLQYVYSH